MAENRIQELIARLKDPAASVRYAAAEALGAIGPAAKDAVPALIEALKDPKIEVLCAMVVALALTRPEAKDAVRALREALEDFDPDDVCPCWNAHRRELTLGRKLVKKFRQPAKNQELILRVFEEEGWPESIDDPLPGSAEIRPGDRLHNAVQRLNTDQRDAHIIFERDGTGGGIHWRRSRNGD
jgi:hypothetical protein